MRQNRELLCILALLFISTSGLANGINNHERIDYKGECQNNIVIPCFSDTYIHDGFYFGAGFGYDMFDVTQNINLFDIKGNFILSNPANSAKGFLGNLFIGYDRYFDWIYIGGEAFAKYTGADDASFYVDAYQAHHSFHSSYGFSILPGIRPTEMAVIYIRVGYVLTQMNVHESGIFLEKDSHDSKAISGMDYGVGFEVAIYNKFSLRGEYIYTPYRTFSTSVVNTHVNPSKSEFTFNVIYHWC